MVHQCISILVSYKSTWVGHYVHDTTNFATELCRCGYIKNVEILQNRKKSCIKILKVSVVVHKYCEK